MSIPFRIKVKLLSICIAASLFTLALYICENAKKDIDSYERVAHSYQMLRKLTRVQSGIKDNVINSSSFLISGDVKYLELLESSNILLKKRLNELSEDSGDKLQQKNFQQLQELVSKRIAISDSNIALRINGGEQLVVQLYESNMEDAMMFRISMQTATIEERQRRLLDNHIAAFKSVQETFMRSVIIIIIVAFAFIGIILFIIFRQIRHRKNIENQIKRMNADLEKEIEERTSKIVEKDKRYRKILDNMLEGVQIISYDWEYLYLNDTAVKQSKSSREELLGQNMFKKYKREDNPTLFAVMKRCMQTKEPAKFENQFVFPDGSTNYFELSIEPFEEGLFILSMGITERRIREEEIKQRMSESKRILHEISHEIRQPVATMLGISYLIENKFLSEEELKNIIPHIKSQATLLDKRTKNLSLYVSSLKVNER